MNSQSNQTVTSKDLLIWLTTVGMIVWLFVSSIVNAFSAKHSDLAQFQANGLALQLSGANLPQLKKNTNLSRTPSSIIEENDIKLNYFGHEGAIGKDPWGNPFSYQIVKNKGDKSAYIVVWSAGANSSFETSVASWESSSRGKIQFHGDDIGSSAPVF
jgi:hypothetical protein